MTPANVADYAAQIVRAFADADVARLTASLADAETATSAAFDTGAADSEWFSLLATAVSSIENLLQRMERQHLENRQELEKSFRLLLLLSRGRNLATAVQTSESCLPIQ